MTKLTAEDFLENVKDHRMAILHDDGFHRNIKFAAPGTFNRWFGLVTWPFHLTIYGDMGCWTFQRAQDMFSFFVRNEARTDELQINPSYWEEKLVSQNSYGRSISPSRKFDQAIFAEQVVDEFMMCRHDIPHGSRWEIWEDIKEELLPIDNETEAYDALYNFHHKDFRFDDISDANFTAHTPTFLWCLYAIVWGIKRYRNRDIEEIQS